MSRAKGFCDLNIPYHPKVKEVVLRALSLGYQTIAINQNVKGPNGLDTKELPVDTKHKAKSKKKQFKQQDIGFPKPKNIEISEADLRGNNITRKPVILNRVTITHSDPSSPFLTKHLNDIKQFDLVAIVPENEAALKQIIWSGTVNTDIISLTEHYGYNPNILSRSLLRSARERDIYFEICYGPSLTDSIARKNTISLANDLHRVNRSANIIITSGAWNATRLRSPYDAINFGRFLSLSEMAAKSAVVYTAHNAIYCATARRIGISKCVSKITVLDEESENVKYKGLEDARDFLKICNGEVRKKKRKIKATVNEADGEVKKKRKRKATVNDADGEVKKRKVATDSGVDGELKEEVATFNGVDSQVKEEKNRKRKKKVTVSGVDGEVKREVATDSGDDGEVKKKKKKTTVTLKVPIKKVLVRKKLKKVKAKGSGKIIKMEKTGITAKVKKKKAETKESNNKGFIAL